MLRTALTAWVVPMPGRQDAHAEAPRRDDGAATTARALGPARRAMLRPLRDITPTMLGTEDIANAPQVLHSERVWLERLATRHVPALIASTERSLADLEFIHWVH